MYAASCQPSSPTKLETTKRLITYTKASSVVGGITNRRTRTRSALRKTENNIFDPLPHGEDGQSSGTEAEDRLAVQPGCGVDGVLCRAAGRGA